MQHYIICRILCHHCHQPLLRHFFLATQKTHTEESIMINYLVQFPCQYLVTQRLAISRVKFTLLCQESLYTKAKRFTRHKNKDISQRKLQVDPGTKGMK